MNQNTQNSETKKWIWVPCQRELFKPAYVIEETSTHVVAQSNVLENFKNTEVFKMNPQKFDKTEDLASLSHLNEPSVLHNLKKRYEESLIYTYSGLFLISLNPYKFTGIYSDEIKKEVMMRKSREGTPHIFSIANEAYRCMLNTRKNQSILITGESGAGKTENTKKVIEFLAYVSNGTKESQKSIDSLLLCANPILEAFGNAKTIKNDNSSRFGKFIQLKFKGGNICGARIEKYLLEKSRVVYQSNEERSYHIFYYLLKGSDEVLRKELSLTNDPNDYKCLRFSCKSRRTIDNTFEESLSDDRKEFERLNQYFENLGISDQIKYYKVISAILHLSNIEFDENNDKAIIKNEHEAEIACNLLNISVIDFIKEVLHPSIKAGNELVNHFRTKEQSIKIIEGLMKLLYESLFDKLIFDINAILDRFAGDSFIGVLDIAGFEIFDTNSFEQLCINYTNEKLQQFFNHHMFILEQEIYKNECIDWNFIDFGLDLEPTISVIESSNPIGILSYLDEECVMPCATDETLLNKLKSINRIEKNPFRSSFKLKHYAGYVEYEVKDWLDKNKDVHSESLHNLLLSQQRRDQNVSSSSHSLDGKSTKHSGNSHNSKVSNGQLVQYNSNHLNSFISIKKGIFRTVGQSHRENLKRLMDLLKETEPHFVRCILPNLNKSSDEFNKKLIVDQLRCNGVLEGIRISRLGYPSRLYFTDFNERYTILFDTCKSNNSEWKMPKDITQSILESVCKGNNDYRIGNTMVFFRQGILADIEDLRDKKVSNIAKSIQLLIRQKLQIRKLNLEKERIQAIAILQENSRKSISFLKWKWWHLFLKIKPLLEVKKNENEVKEKEEQIRGYIEIIENEKLDRKSIENQLNDLKNVLEELKKSAELSKMALNEKDELLKGIRNEDASLVESSNIKEKSMEEMKSKIEQCQIKEENHKSRIDELIEIINELNSAIKSKESEISCLVKSSEDVDASLKSKDNIISQLTKKDGNLNSILKSKEDEITKLINGKNELAKERDVLASKNGDLTSKLGKSDEEIAELINTVNMVKNDKSCYEKSIFDLNEKLTLQEDCIKKLKNENDEIQYENENLQNEIKKKNILDQEFANQISNLKQDLEYTKMKNVSMENINSSLKKQNLDLESKIDGFNKAKNFNQESISTFEKQIKTLKQKLSNEESINQSLINDKDELYKENLRLMQTRLDDLFKSEVEFNQVKKSLQMEIQKLESENSKLKTDLYNNLSGSSGSDDVAFDKINKLFENEKGLRKQLDTKVIELENLNVKNENNIRELNSKIEGLESINNSLEKENETSNMSRSEIKKIKKELEQITTFVNLIIDDFQEKYLKVCKSKDDLITEGINEIEKNTDVIRSLRSEIDQLKFYEEENQLIKRELEILAKNNSILKNEIDSVAVTNSSNLLQINELKDHITNLEIKYNEREDEVLKIYEKYNNKILMVENKEKEFENNLLILRAVINKDREESNENAKVQAVTKTFTKKINELNEEIVNLNKLMNNKDLEIIKINSLLGDALILKDLSQSNNSLAKEDQQCKPIDIIEKQCLVSTFVVDKDRLKALERKNLINCKCQYSGKVKIVEVLKENKEESVKLSNEVNLLNLKLKQAERALQEQTELAEAMRGCVSVLRKKK